MTGFKSKKTAALDEEGMYLVHQTAQPAQEPVAWPCVIAEANFEQNTITLEMQCSDYKVGAGQHWLYTTPPQRPWVDLTPKDLNEIFAVARTGEHAVNLAADKLKEKNNG